MFDKEKLKEIEKATQAWGKAHAREFDAERRKEFACRSGIPVQRCYTLLDLEERGFDYLKDVGLPGDYPFVRGTRPTMYRGRLWESLSYTGRGTPEECNELWKSMLTSGLDRVFIALDLPTQLGLDPDDAMAEGEVGRVGLSMTSLRDWEIALDGINVGDVMVSFVSNALAAVSVASHIAIAERQGVDLKRLRGECQNDILKEYTVRGNYIFPPGPSLRLGTDIICYCAEHMPRYEPITVSVTHYAHRGATPVHAAAFGLANGFAYLQEIVDRGVDIDAVAPHIYILANSEHTDFFQEIAKHRAMRKIYARTLKERFGAKKPESMMCRVHGANGGLSLQKQQYLNNIARNTIAGMALALSGCNAIGLRAYDEHFGTPTRDAILTSLRTQQVIAYETGITDTVDPLAGSYFIESLTLDFEKHIMQELEAIEKRGGVLRCIEEGYFHRALAEDGYNWQKAIESGEMVWVGVNKFTSEDEENRPTKIYRAKPEFEAQRVEALGELRRKREAKRVQRTLDEVKAMASLPAKPENNLMPAMIDAVKAYCTNGEIAQALKAVWGEHTEARLV
ncbi:MAG: methylmalonyl-CoA mutase [Chloroflexi bacterium]|nr:methylmalonyl-CoA mutase [Chloroflexota bacterium]